MYTVVYLIDAQKHIVVPKIFIFGLSQQFLDNYGKNRNEKHLVFFSKNEVLAPNFSANLSKNFPPNQDEVCYVEQIKYFFGEFNLLIVFFLNLI